MIDRIAVDPRIHFGKPHIVGTRITVQNVLELVENGVSFERIIQGFQVLITCASGYCE
jgi:uncharacterized protein (DUF433 family)